MKGMNRTNLCLPGRAEAPPGAILKGAKTLAQMVAELGTIKTIVRRWLRRNHWDLWMEHRASVEEM